MSQVRIALIGCGTAAEYYHLPALRSLVDPASVWFVDRDLRRAELLARQLGAPRDHAATSWEPLDVEAAIVATPNHLHAPIASALLARGTHVLSEKPLANSRSEGAAVVDAVQGETILAVGHFRRFFPTTTLVADLITRRVCGEPRSFSAEEGYVFAWESQSAEWLDPEKAGGGVLGDLGPHVFDLLRAWFGDLSVESYEDDFLGGVEADALVRLAGDVSGTVELSRTRTLRNTILIECSDGSIEAPLSSPGEIILEIEGKEHRVDVAAADAYPDAFRAQLADFLTAIEQRSPPTVGGAEGLAVLELIDDAYRMRRRLSQPWLTELA